MKKTPGRDVITGNFYQKFMEKHYTNSPRKQNSNKHFAIHLIRPALP